MKKRFSFIRIILSILVLMGMHQYSLCMKIMIEESTVEVFRKQYPDDFNHIQAMARCVHSLRELGFEPFIEEGTLTGIHSTGRKIEDVTNFLPPTPDNHVLGDFHCTYDPNFERKIKEVVRKIDPSGMRIVWDDPQGSMILRKYSLAQFASIIGNMNEAGVGKYVFLKQIQYPMVRISPEGNQFLAQRSIKPDDMVWYQVKKKNHPHYGI